MNLHPTQPPAPSSNLVIHVLADEPGAVAAPVLAGVKAGLFHNEGHVEHGRQIAVVVSDIRGRTRERS